MSQQTQTAVLGAVAVLALGLVGWGLWNQFGSSSTASEGPGDRKVLCARCGYFAETSLSSLKVKSGQRPARAPAYGPGYICPKCGQATLYLNPCICSACQTPFLVGGGDGQPMQAVCPKCKKAQ
jgi:hypothetical protein